MFYSEGELTVESPGGLVQEKSRCKVVTGSSYGKMERLEVCVAVRAVRGRLQSPESQTVHFLNLPSSPFLCLVLQNHQNLKLCTFSIFLLRFFCALFSFLHISVSRSVQHCRISVLCSCSSSLLCAPLCPTLPYICALFLFQFSFVSLRSVLLSFSSFSFCLCSVCSLFLKSVPFPTFLFLRFILFSNSFHSVLSYALPFRLLTYLLTYCG